VRLSSTRCRSQSSLSPGQCWSSQNDYIIATSVPGDPPERGPVCRNTYWEGKLDLQGRRWERVCGDNPNGRVPGDPTYADFLT